MSSKPLNGFSVKNNHVAATIHTLQSVVCITQIFTVKVTILIYTSIFHCLELSISVPLPIKFRVPWHHQQMYTTVQFGLHKCGRLQLVCMVFSNMFSHVHFNFKPLLTESAFKRFLIGMLGHVPPQASFCFTLFTTYSTHEELVRVNHFHMLIL